MTHFMLGQLREPISAENYWSSSNTQKQSPKMAYTKTPLAKNPPISNSNRMLVRSKAKGKVMILSGSDSARNQPDQRINNLSLQTSGTMSLADLTRNSFQSGISPTKVSLGLSLRLKACSRLLSGFNWLSYSSAATSMWQTFNAN